MLSKSRILKYAKRSKIMDVSINLGPKSFSFNLNEELVIDENDMTEELKNQPSYYGYLGMLRVKLQRKVEDLKIEVSKEYSSLYFKHTDNNKDMSNKAEAAKIAKYKTESNPLYIAKCNQLNKAQEDLGVIQVCLEAFDQRSRMIQSLNANLRKEN